MRDRDVDRDGVGRRYPFDKPRIPAAIDERQEDHDPHDVEQRVRHRGALAVSARTQGGQLRRDRRADVVAQNEWNRDAKRMVRVSAEPAVDGYDDHHCDGGRTALDEDRERRADKDGEDRLVPNHLQHAGQGRTLLVAQVLEGLLHGVQAEKQDAQTEQDHRDRFPPLALGAELHGEPDSDQRHGVHADLENLHAGHRRDEPAGYRRADVGAENDADRLFERKQSGVDQADDDNAGGRT